MEVCILRGDRHSDRSKEQIVARPKCPNMHHVCSTGQHGQNADSARVFVDPRGSRTFTARGTVPLRPAMGARPTEEVRPVWLGS